MSKSTKSVIGKVLTTDTQAAVIIPLLAGPATTKQLNKGIAYLNHLETKGVVKRAGRLAHNVDSNGNPTKGRPAVVWSLTRKGRDRAKAAQARAEKAAAAAA